MQNNLKSHHIIGIMRPYLFCEVFVSVFSRSFRVCSGLLYLLVWYVMSIIAIKMLKVNNCFAKS